MFVHFNSHEKYELYLNGSFITSRVRGKRGDIHNMELQLVYKNLMSADWDKISLHVNKPKYL